jgi:hypothetical protein
VAGKYRETVGRSRRGYKGFGRGEKYGPPPYDVSRKGNLELALATQSNKGTPAIYISHWDNFGDEVLMKSPLVKRQLRKLATRGMFRMKRKIHIGDARNGHARNKIKVRFHKFGREKWDDRMVFTVDYMEEDEKDYWGWIARVKRSTYPDKASYINAMRTAKANGGTAPFGPGPGIIGQTARELGSPL